MTKKEIDKSKEKDSPLLEKSYHEMCTVGFESFEEINEKNKKDIEEIKKWNASIYNTSQGIPDSKLNLVLGPDK